MFEEFEVAYAILHKKFVFWTNYLTGSWKLETGSWKSTVLFKTNKCTSIKHQASERAQKGMKIEASS
jgi:hypothetical protein